MRVAKTLTSLVVLIVLGISAQIAFAGPVLADGYRYGQLDQLEGTSWVNDDDMIAFHFKKDGVIEIDDAEDTETAQYRVNGNTVTITKKDGRYISATIDGNKMSFKTPNGYTVILEKQR